MPSSSHIKRSLRLARSKCLTPTYLLRGLISPVQGCCRCRQHSRKPACHTWTECSRVLRSGETSKVAITPAARESTEERARFLNAFTWNDSCPFPWLEQVTGHLTSEGPGNTILPPAGREGKYTILVRGSPLYHTPRNTSRVDLGARIPGWSKAVRRH